MIFQDRHIGPSSEEIEIMLKEIGAESLDALISETVPDGIRLKKASLDLPSALSEHDALSTLKEYAAQNKRYKSFIGQGYYSCIVPEVLKRCILENPCWYTQYTPYQAEIAQGRLEALINFQTMIVELTGMELANSSLLDEGTAVAEAMGLMIRQNSKVPVDKQCFAVHTSVFAQSLEVLRTRADSLGVSLCMVSELSELSKIECNGVIIQSPACDGSILPVKEWAEAAHSKGVLITVATDLLAQCLLSPVAEDGADIVVGSSQRLGVPMGFGGPHAAFFATHAKYQRDIPGRLVGISKDSNGENAYRLALQTREQHIKRERATSNICTAQVLLAIMSSMYAVYHGPLGLKSIAERVCKKTNTLRSLLEGAGVEVLNETSFDTLSIKTSSFADIMARAERSRINVWNKPEEKLIRLSLDESTTEEDVATLYEVLTGEKILNKNLSGVSSLPCSPNLRKVEVLKHPVFSEHHSETKMLRYITCLQNRDLSLAHSMIPLGSCTMKLNAASEMVPVTWEEFADVHPFTPKEQVPGYLRLISELESYLAEITGLPAVSVQPNAGSQGEYAGLTTISAYFKARGDENRKVCLIPSSAHGTNPASAQMAGMYVKVIRCDEEGNVDLPDLKKNVEQYGETIAALMITYPSTHGVFEDSIVEICSAIHGVGGRVYMDGANMNAQVGICRPGDFGVDICHLNLHKTFCIPHGGGGPGVGPIAAVRDLRPYLPGHAVMGISGSGAVASAPFGSAGILVIPWMYIRMMGAKGLRRATEVAILNANYIAHRLSKSFPVLYTGENGRVAHECIIDLRSLKRELGVTVTDIAKRLIDFGFHAPTVSFPVIETVMIEPTESEDLNEMNRFCEAMECIAQEIEEIRSGSISYPDSALAKSPHTVSELTSTNWEHPYSREKAVFPLHWVRDHKFWPAVGRIDNAYGDRNLFCVCPSPADYT